MKTRTWMWVLVMLLGAILLSARYRTAAQSGVDPWTKPLNLSKSGAASQPVISVDSDGILHAFWWDSVLGELHSTVGLTQTEPSVPDSLPGVYGDRLDVVDPQTQQHTLTLVPPLQMRAFSSSSGVINLFWLDTRNQLLTLAIIGGRASATSVLGSSALLYDVTADNSGGMQLAYVKTSEEPGSPAGVYYRYYDGRSWQPSALIVSSRYFRAASNSDVSISVAGSGQGLAVVAWDDPRLANGLFSKTEDGGKTWTDPQSISSSVPAAQIRVTYTPRGQFMLVWRESQTGSCQLEQSISSDSLRSWSAPVRVLDDLERCPGQWVFVPDAGGGMWFLGMPTSLSQDNSSPSGVSANQGTLTAWDGQHWLATAVVSVSFDDPTISKTVTLGCLHSALTKQTLGVIGCDQHGDVWVARNRVPLAQLGQALTSAWASVDNQSVDNQTSPEGDLLGNLEDLPAMVSDANGQLYALWSQSVQATKPYRSLYATVWDGDAWARYSRVLNSPAPQDGSDSTAGYTIRADQPSLALDNGNVLHAVWVNGPIGPMLYSRATTRNPLSSREWTTPTQLLQTGVLGSWPQVIADPRGANLYVIYAVPYNEGRGIYLLQSSDSGLTWHKPLLVFDAGKAGWYRANKPRIALNPATGRLHAVWLRAGGADDILSRAIYYASSGDGGKTWTEPIQLGTGSVDWPRLVMAGSHQVLVTWSEMDDSSGLQSATPFITVARSSQNDGDGWNAPIHVPGFEQVSGPVDTTSVQDGIVHIIGVGETATNESSLLYCRWIGQTCDQRDSYNLGQPAYAGDTAVVVPVPGHNQLGIAARIWIRQWNGSGEYGLVTAFRGVTSTLAIAPAPTFTPLPVATVQATATAAPTPTSTPVVVSSNIAPSGDASAQTGISPLVLSGVLTTVIVVGALAFLFVVRARR